MSRRIYWIASVLMAMSIIIASCQPAAVPTPEPQQPQQPQPQQTQEQQTAPQVSVPEGYVDTTQYKKDGPYTVCFSNASVSNDWRVSMVAHLGYGIDKFTADGLIKDYFETDANDDPNKQISDTEDLLGKGCDVLIVSASQSEPLTPVVEKAMNQGIPVVTLDRNIASDNYVTFVEQSSCDMGATQAKWLAEELGGEGNIVMLSGIAGATPAEDRLRCAREVFAEYPGIKELAQAYVNWSPVEGKKAMENWLVTFPQIDGVWSDGLQGSGAIEAFVEAGLPVPPNTNEDYNRFLKQMDQYGFEGVAVSFNVRMGYKAVEVALDILQGKPVPHYVNMEAIVIDNSNYKNYLRADLPDNYYAASMPEVVDILYP